MFNYTQVLLQKVAQLEEAWTQKDKFIHSSRMIVRFREDHISRLEKKLKAGQGLFSDKESQTLIDQLKEEIQILTDQVCPLEQSTHRWKWFLFYPEASVGKIQHIVSTLSLLYSRLNITQRWLVM